MSDKASSTNPNLTWELSNGASASIRRGGGNNNYQLCVAYRNSDSSEDVIHPLITSAGLYLKNIIYAISAAHLTNTSYNTDAHKYVNVRFTTANGCVSGFLLNHEAFTLFSVSLDDSITSSLSSTQCRFYNITPYGNNSVEGISIAKDTSLDPTTGYRLKIKYQNSPPLLDIVFIAGTVSISETGTAAL